MHIFKISIQFMQDNLRQVSEAKDSCKKAYKNKHKNRILIDHKQTRK